MRNCRKSQGPVWNYISLFKGYTGGASESETWIEKVQGSIF